MNENQKQIITHVILHFTSEKEITEDSIIKYVDIFSMIYPISKNEKEEVIKDLYSKLSVKMDRGVCVKEKDHVSWYYSAKSDLTSEYWERYVKYLQSNMGFNSEIINSLDSSTDEMMDMLGNPQQIENFSRKGLVIGDVQSGKTSTYTALINKAADAGYKVIILLTGTIEKLRKQTQGRLDEGFIGLDSTAFIRGKDDVHVGVGKIDDSFFPWSMTSTSSDFNTATAIKSNVKLSSIDNPVLFVLKKNKSVLEKLEEWLRVYNVSDIDNKVHLPMLLIDDEADNASINSNKEEVDPTAINRCIRNLLRLFVKSSYVGFTATPFANIFINPDTNDEMLKDDLFPRDFIYSLDPPSNYVGARSIFNEDGRHHYMLKSNDDCSFHIPIKHKKDFVMNSLPNSLKEAIASFFITNTIRDLRGQNKKHRSMLINVSIYIAVQKNMSDFIENYVRDLQREIKNYYLIGEEALEYESFSFLKMVYEKHFEPLKHIGFEDEDMSFTWNDIQKALHPSIAPIVVKYVNGGNAPKNLNYDECEEDGLRLIAVGGYSLSRGLTLEGLSTSYFYRNSRMYDTLMQMGRWFGYRPGYESLCQIWLTEDAVDWYSYISEASDELRKEVRKMRDSGLTPIDFGLAVRSDINSLLVTAVNKMRTAKECTMTVSLNGQMIETPYIINNIDIVRDNLFVIENWLDKLKNDGFSFSTREDLAVNKPQILNIPKSYIVDFLRSYKSHPYNMEFNTDNIASILKDNNDITMDNWDVLIATGEGADVKFSNLEIKTVKRIFALKNDAIQLSGSKSRLGTTSSAKGGLSKLEAKEIENEIRIERQKNNNNKVNFSENEYFNSGKKRNPLLVIYPITLSSDTKNENGETYQDLKKEKLCSKYSMPIIGLSIGIPKIKGVEAKSYKYKINVIKHRELFEFDNSDDFDEDID